MKSLAFRKTYWNLDWFLSRFRSGETFTLSRWGDGEWFSVLGLVNGANCDGHPYSDKLRDELRSILLSRPTYVLGMQPMAMINYSDPIGRFLEGNGLMDLSWTDGDVFHDEAKKGNLHGVMDAIKGRKVLMIGSDHLTGLSGGSQLDIRGHIDVGGTEVFERRDQIVTDALWYLEGKRESYVVSVCAGMTANYIIHRLHRRMGKKHTLIDFGSLWDPLVGVNSRKYMRGEL